jgi:hypothetical protein
VCFHGQTLMACLPEASSLEQSGGRLGCQGAGYQATDQGEPDVSTFPGQRLNVKFHLPSLASSPGEHVLAKNYELGMGPLSPETLGQ